MPQLKDALRRSAEAAAYLYVDTPQGYRALVVHGAQAAPTAPGEGTRYLVRVARGGAPPTAAFAAPDLPTAWMLLAPFDLARFNPTAAS